MALIIPKDVSLLHTFFQCVQRTLDTLVSEGRVREKQYGKQKVYVVNQSLFPDVDEEEIKKMDKEITDLSGQLQSMQKECQQLDSRE